MIGMRFTMMQSHVVVAWHQIFNDGKKKIGDTIFHSANADFIRPICLKMMTLLNNRVSSNSDTVAEPTMSTPPRYAVTLLY